MKFLAVVLVFIIAYKRGDSLTAWYHDGWFYRFVAFVGRYFPAPLVLPLALLLPLICLYFLLNSAQSLWFGLPYLVLLVMVLLYSLGRGAYQQVINDYLVRWRAGELQAAYHVASSFCRDGRQGNAESLAELHCYTVQAILYQALERWFAVLFWFLVAGPLGALGYRLARLYRTPPNGEQVVAATAAARLTWWLEWLPVRLLGLSFALTGNFASAVAVLREYLHWFGASSPEMLQHYAIAALGENESLACQDDAEAAIDSDREQQLANGARQIEAITQLLWRCLVLWLLLMALLVLSV